MKESRNKILGNLITLVLIIILLTIGTTLLGIHYEQARTSFTFNPIYTTCILIVCFGGIGILLGLENVLTVRATKHIDKFKLILFTLPSLIVSMTHVWSYWGVLDFNKAIYLYIVENDYILIVSSIIFGLSLSSSLTKNK